MLVLSILGKIPLAHATLRHKVQTAHSAEKEKQASLRARHAIIVEVWWVGVRD